MRVRRLAPLALSVGALTVAPAAVAQTVPDCAPDTVVAAATGARRAILERARAFHNWAPDYQQVNCLNVLTGAVQPHDGGVCVAPTWWRTDCSGFVSAAWGLAESVDTAILGTGGALGGRTWVRKSWDDLEPGDAINEAHDHSLLFTGWLDAAHSSFCVLEEVHVAYTDPWGGLGCIADSHSTGEYKALGFTPIGLVDVDDAGAGPGALDGSVGEVVGGASPPPTSSAAPARPASSTGGCAFAPRGVTPNLDFPLLGFGIAAAALGARRRGAPRRGSAALLTIASAATACSDGAAPPARVDAAREETAGRDAGEADVRRARDAAPRDAERDRGARVDAGRDSAVRVSDAAADARDATLEGARDANDANDATFEGAKDAGGTPDARVIATLASGQAGPMGIAVDGTSVYWTNLWTGTVMKAPLDGSEAPTLLATGPGGASGVAVSDDKVYWASSTGVLRVPIQGGQEEVLADLQHQPSGIAVHGTNVYFTDYTSGFVVKVPKAGGTPAQIGQAQDPFGIAVDDLRVYWASGSGSVLAVSLDGGVTTTLAAVQQAQPVGLALGNGHIFWTDYTAGTVTTAWVDGSSALTLATGQLKPSAITTDGVSVYWATTTTVMKAPVSGGAPVTLASAQARPSGVALDGTYVYWTSNGDGTVKKTAK